MKVAVMASLQTSWKPWHTKSPNQPMQRQMKTIGINWDTSLMKIYRGRVIRKTLAQCSIIAIMHLSRRHQLITQLYGCTTRLLSFVPELEDAE
jgi:hypothetical protein